MDSNIQQLRIMFLVCLWLVTLPMGSVAQTSTHRWAVAISVSGEQYQPIGEQMFAGNVPYFPGTGLIAKRYLKPGFDFRTRASIAPLVQDPSSGEPSTSHYFSFDYAIVVKLNNGIMFKEDAILAPYLSAGAGGSYHAGQADAYSPIGMGISMRTGPRTKLELEVQRKISWNASPQTLGLLLLFSYAFPGRTSNVPLPPEEKPSAQDRIASQLAADSDGDGLADTEDDCPYEAGFIQNNGCPVIDSSDTEVKDNEAIPVTMEQEDLVTNPLPGDHHTDTKEIPEDSSLAGSDADTSEDLHQVINPEAELEPEIQSLPFEQDPEEATESPCMLPSANVFMFDLNDAELSVANREILQELSQHMLDCPTLRLRLTGYADEKPTQDANLVLSIQRAYNIKYFLVYEYGISQSRINSTGQGYDPEVANPRSVSLQWSW